MLVLLFLQVLGTLYLPTLMAAIVHNGIVKGNINYDWRADGIMLGVVLLTEGISVLSTYLSITSFAAMGRDFDATCSEKHRSLTIDEFNSFGPTSMTI